MCQLSSASRCSPHNANIIFREKNLVKKILLERKDLEYVLHYRKSHGWY